MANGKLINLVDRLIPVAITGIPDHPDLLRARVMVALTNLFMWTVFITGTVLGILSAIGIITVWEPVIGLAISFGLYLCQTVYFKKTANMIVAANIMMFILFVSTGAVIVLTGGWPSPASILFIFIPVCGFSVAGKKYGLIWTGFAALAFIVLLALYINNVNMIQLVGYSLLNPFGFASWSFCWLALFGSITLYSMMMGDLNALLNRDRKKLQAKATFDSLTGTYNRQVFQKIIAEQLTNAGDQGQGFLFLRIDIDIPEYQEGTQRDQLIKKAAHSLTNIENQQTLVSRYGDSSFILIIENISDQDAAQQAISALQNSIKKTFKQQLSNKIVIGAVMVPLYTTNIDILTQAIRKAIDEARHTEDKVVLLTEQITIEKDRYRQGQWVTVTFNQILNT